MLWLARKMNKNMQVPFANARTAPMTETLFDAQGKPNSPHGFRVPDLKEALLGGTICAVSDEEGQQMLLPVFQAIARSFLRECREQRLSGPTWRDEAQAATTRGSRAVAVQGNHTTRVYLPGSSGDATLDWLSRLTGDQPTAQRSVLSQRADETTIRLAGGSQDIPAAPIEYLPTLPPDTAAVLSGRPPPMRVTSLPWFKDGLHARIGAEICARYDKAPG